MMKALIALLVLASFLLSACQKNFELENAENIISLPDSNYLHKIYYLIKNAGGTYDTAVISTVNYDNQKRVVSVLEQQQLNGYGINDHYYYYNGNDSLPFKSRHAQTDLVIGENDTVIIQHTYNTLGQKIKDSANIVYHNPQIIPPVPPSHGIIVSRYSYGAGRIYGESVHFDSANLPTEYYRDTAVLNAANNVTSYTTYYNFQGSYFPVKTYAYEYDNKLNPFAKSGLHKVQRYFEDDYYRFYESQGQQNVTKVILDGLTEHQSSYSYNSSGLPIMQIGLSNSDEFKIIYTYKVL